MEDFEREKLLLDWTMDKCSDENSDSLDFEEGWSMIKLHGLDVLNEMLKNFLLNKDGKERRDRKPLGNRGWISLYTISYQMSNLSTTSGEVFYERICQFISTYVKSNNVLGNIEKADLPEFIAIWQSYKLMIKWIVHLFMHLESSVIRLNELLTLTSVALVNFQQSVYSTFHSNLTALCLSLILKEREGELIDVSLLQESLQIYLMMGLASMIDTAFATEKREKLKNIDAALRVYEYTSFYLRDYEGAILQSTRDFYQHKSSEWLGSMDVPSYINRVREALQQEEARCAQYLSSGTKPKLVRVVLVECVVAHSDHIFDAARDMLWAMYDNSQSEDTFEFPAEKTSLVQSLYRLCCQSQALEPGQTAYQLATRMRSVFLTYVVELGLKALEDKPVETTRVAEDSKQTKPPTSDTNSADSHTITAILRLFHYAPLLVRTVFADDLSFNQACNEAFTTIVNKDLGKSSVMQMLAAYCDNLLKGNMKVPETEVDSLLQRCMCVFSHLLDKDMFADLHRANLGKRLLSKRSASSDSEKLIVGLMKMQCGAQFTSKLEGMLNDYTYATSASLQEYETALKAWQGQQTSRAVKQITFTNTLLTASFWPTARPRVFHYPAEMAALQAHYTQWFKTKHNGRNLQWVPTLGDVSLAMSVKGKTYEITVSVLQAVVLKVFDQRSESMSFETIKTLTGIEEDEVLKRTLHSLACQKFKVLRRQTESKHITTEDVFSSNTAFANNLRKFRIPMPVLDDAEAASGNKFLAEERGHAVDASIVRIMKARKILAHTDLQYEVLRQITSFQPEPKFIKQRIESLLEREYLERDAADTRMYKYMP